MSGSDSPACREKIDVSRQVMEMERLLRSGADFPVPHRVLAILRRWQFDEMLDDASREKASDLVRKFELMR